MKKNYNSASILNQSLVDVDEISDLKSLGLSNLIEENQPSEDEQQEIADLLAEVENMSDEELGL